MEWDSHMSIMTCLCFFFMVTLLLLHVGLLVQNTIPPSLILYGLPTGCSFPSTAPAQLYNTGPILQELLHTGLPMGLDPPALLPHNGLFSMGYCSSLELLLQGYPWVFFILCCPVGSSMVAHGDLLCEVHTGCRCTACSTMSLSRAAWSFCSTLEYLLLSFCTYLVCRAFSLSGFLMVELELALI